MYLFLYLFKINKIFQILLTVTGDGATSIRFLESEVLLFSTGKVRVNSQR